jgi:hypothetical protein
MTELAGADKHLPNEIDKAAKKRYRIFPTGQTQARKCDGAWSLCMRAPTRGQL